MGSTNREMQGWKVCKGFCSPSSFSSGSLPSIKDHSLLLQVPFQPATFTGVQWLLLLFDPSSNGVITAFYSGPEVLHYPSLVVLKHDYPLKIAPLLNSLEFPNLNVLSGPCWDLAWYDNAIPKTSLPTKNSTLFDHFSISSYQGPGLLPACHLRV